jgi:hypothetical protein
MPLDGHIAKRVQVSTWAEFVSLVQGNFAAPCWLFRGQSDADWGLQSSFERAFRSVDREHWTALEAYITSAFRRRVHLFDSHFPSDEDAI